MTKEPLHIYLNDHLAGATAGVELVRTAAENHDGELGEFFQELADAISSDYETLTSLINEMGAKASGAKEAFAKIGAEVSESKFSGDSVGDPEFGTFLTLETLSIGVEGKLCMWKALKVVQDDYRELGSADMDTLIERAQSQRDRLEGKRLEIAGSALRSGKVEA
ncbi:MAG: hypothetical protein QOE11_1912 [Solirubrobacteraceae bacterium]|jgi:hypothetical protein|nr:hypothetical protein [Solirubrobacteraceae bacterium]